NSPSRACRCDYLSSAGLNAGTAFGQVDVRDPRAFLAAPEAVVAQHRGNHHVSERIAELVLGPPSRERAAEIDAPTVRTQMRVSVPLRRVEGMYVVLS